LMKNLQNEYQSKTKENILESEVNRLLDVPFVGSVRSPGIIHPNLSHLQKIIFDLAIVYRQGYCELTMLSSRAILEALINSKLEKPIKGLYNKIEALQYSEQLKKEAHIIRRLGNLVAHWSETVTKKRSIKKLEITLTDTHGSISFEVQIPERYINANEDFLFKELMATKCYSSLISIASQLFPDKK